MEHTQASLEKRYLVYQIFRSLWFLGAVWLLFYRLFMSDQSVGVLDAISFGIGLLAEIPSGALADHFGRKKLTVIGVVASAIGMSMQGFAHGYAIILIGQIIVTAGWALSSGADDALFYEALNYDEESSKWKKLVSRGNQLKLLATLVCYLIGGFLYAVSPRLPFLACIITIGGVIPIWTIAESRHRPESAERVMRQYFLSLKDGVAQLGHREIIGYLPIVVIVQGFFYSFGYGLLRPILQTRFGFGAAPGAAVIFACGLVAFFFQRMQLKYIDYISEKQSIASIIIVTIIALLFGCLPVGRAGFIVIMVIYVNEYLLDPLISNSLNKHIVSAHRATALSAASFLKSLPYVITAPVIGYLNIRGQLHYYLIATALFFLVAMVVYLSKVKEKTV